MAAEGLETFLDRALQYIEAFESDVVDIPAGHFR